MCALVTGFQTCALPIYGLSRDLEFCAHHPRLGNINQLRKGTKGRVGPADELFNAIIIIECGATELHPTLKQRRPENRFIRKQDRKSVVKGNGVTVSIALGVRRISKKKKNKTQRI